VPMRAARAVERTLPEVTRPAPTRPIARPKGLRQLRVRYDRLEVIIDAWTTRAAAILDRLLHRSVVLNIRGRSYRPQDLEKLLK
jgi:IstB-like ATP binding protein